MKRIATVLAAFGIATAAFPAVATAAPWQTINGRQANIEARINQGIRSGALNRAEATRLRSQFRDLARLEARYRATRPGLTLAERRDLDRRFDVLSARVKVQKNDRNYRR
jgi:hypothetical protein